VAVTSNRYGVLFARGSPTDIQPDQPRLKRHA